MVRSRRLLSGRPRVSRRSQPRDAGRVASPWAQGKDAEALLVTTSRGAQLHRTAVLRTLDWPTTGRGRRIHDLRH